MKQILTTLFIIILITTYIENTMANNNANNPTVNTNKKIIIAHRGASGYVAEHTLEAKALAYGQNANFIEQDIVLTKDNIPVILHDIHIDTTTNVTEIFPQRKRADGRYYAIDFTLAELKQLKVKERFNEKTKKAVYPNRFPTKIAIFQIPTLEEEIQLIQGLNKSTGKNIGIYPEIKSPAWHQEEGKDISKIVLQILHKYGYSTIEDNFYLQIFDFNEIKRVRTTLNFKGKLIMLLAENSWNEAPNNDYTYFQTKEGLQEISQYATGIGAWIPQIITGKKGQKVQISNLVNDAKNNKLIVHAYTARSDDLPKFTTSFNELLGILFNAGVSGIFTDFPDKAVNFVTKEYK